ncbi:MAG: hypothetical protein LQ344_003853 [Seirophora lacunosa]|nr:MAG: hypothetical protein LQ344_003853 [Seirophora lacunosa]
MAGSMERRFFGSKTPSFGFIFVFVFFIVSVQLVRALPSSDAQLFARDLTADRIAACSSENPEAIYDATCWETLNLTDWLNEWHAPKICGTLQPGINCCLPDEPWSTCFLRLGRGDSGLNCTQLTVGASSCIYNKELSAHLVPEIRAQVRYVLRTIVNVHAFFNNWYTALQYATTNAVLAIDSIVQAIQPPKGLSVSATNALTALVAGFPFIGSPIFGGAISASKLATGLVTGLQQAPGLVKALYPVSGPDARFIRVASLSSELASLNGELADRVNAALWIVMSDKSAFASFASSGAFSGDPGASLPEQVDRISAALQLFVLTSTLAGNGYKAALTSWGCQDADEWVGCGFEGQTAWSYSGSQMLGGVEGWLSTLGKVPTVDASLMQKIVENGWATPESLFEGGINCAASGQSDVSIVGLNAENAFNMDCLNRLPPCYHYPQNAETLESLKEDPRFSGACSFKGGACPIPECPGPFP